MSAENAPAQGSPAQPQQMREFPVDLAGIHTTYANFARVTGTPEELILDFGLNTQMTPNPNEPVRLSHRLVLNYFTAKRLLMALNMAVGQHEAAFGVLETDVQRRARSRPGAPQSAPS
jgi:hypothetical protein